MPTLPLFILASRSPRRQALLAITGWQYQVVTPEIDEDALPGERPDAYVMRLAQKKARRVGVSSPPGALVIACDTTVADGNVLLMKPGDPAEAREMLLRLRGREHDVYTAIVLYDPTGDRLEADLCKTRVPMRLYAESEMEAYIATGDPFDKAGGYAIQHPDFHPVENFSGCYASVMGFPLCHLTRLAARFGIVPPADVPHACQASLDYACPIFNRILAGEQIG